LAWFASGGSKNPGSSDMWNMPIGTHSRGIHHFTKDDSLMSSQAHHVTLKGTGAETHLYPHGEGSITFNFPGILIPSSNPILILIGALPRRKTDHILNTGTGMRTVPFFCQSLWHYADTSHRTIELIDESINQRFLSLTFPLRKLSWFQIGPWNEYSLLSWHCIEINLHYWIWAKKQQQLRTSYIIPSGDCPVPAHHNFCLSQTLLGNSSPTP